MSDTCMVYIGRECLYKASMPVKLEIVTEEGESFVVAMTRAEWSKLLKGDREVPGWIEPLKGDEDDVS